ncbi:hypothetical protein PENTCL1PPCAC_16168, partial [Pristionchus entomophagus]
FVGFGRFDDQAFSILDCTSCRLLRLFLLLSAWRFRLWQQKLIERIFSTNIDRPTPSMISPTSQSLSSQQLHSQQCSCAAHVHVNSVG